MSTETVADIPEIIGVLGAQMMAMYEALLSVLSLNLTFITLAVITNKAGSLIAARVSSSCQQI
jgi:hypothetical protein